MLSYSHLDSQGKRTCIYEINVLGFCLIDWTPNMIYKKLIKFVRKFYLLAWTEKDKEFKMKKKKVLWTPNLLRLEVGWERFPTTYIDQRSKPRAQGLNPQRITPKGAESGSVSRKRQHVPG